MYKQIIIARKDLNMSSGKLAAQVSHGSMSFLTWIIRNNSHPLACQGEYESKFRIENDLYEQWIDGEFTKCVLQAKNKKTVDILVHKESRCEEWKEWEGKDFWLIYDNCHTELEPEENGRTLTVIGFKPMDSEIIDQIGRKYHLYV